MTSALRASRGLYKMLLLTYPQDFRYRFESEMLTTFSDLICGEWEQNGLRRVARVWLAEITGLFSVDPAIQPQIPIEAAMAISVMSSSCPVMSRLCALS